MKRIYKLIIVICLLIFAFAILAYCLTENLNNSNLNNSNSNKKNNKLNEYKKEIVVENNIENKNNMQNNEIRKAERKSENIWCLTIPKINLQNVKIEEGVGQDILARSIGHFPNTNITTGNVCLAAHNRGETTYFSKINRLKEGDEIIYKTIFQDNKYIVKEKKEIVDTDLSCLSQSRENRLTLITCIENKPSFRLCIIAEEEKE